MGLGRCIWVFWFLCLVFGVEDEGMDWAGLRHVVLGGNSLLGNQFVVSDLGCILAFFSPLSSRTFFSALPSFSLILLSIFPASPISLTPPPLIPRYPSRNRRRAFRFSPLSFNMGVVCLPGISGCVWYTVPQSDRDSLQAKTQVRTVCGSLVLNHGETGKAKESCLRLGEG